MNTNSTGRERTAVRIPALLQKGHQAVLNHTVRWESPPEHKTHTSGRVQEFSVTQNCAQHCNLISKHLHQSTKKLHGHLKSLPTPHLHRLPWPSLSQVTFCLQTFTSFEHFIKHLTKKPSLNCQFYIYSFKLLSIRLCRTLGLLTLSMKL